MQLLKKCCSLLLSVLLLSGLALTAFADIETTVSGDSVSIRFDFGAKYADMEFGYEILNPGAELCDVQSEMPETVLGTFAELSQATTDGTGKATVTFSPPAKSGVYTIYAGRTVKKLQGDFEFISKNEVKNLLIQLSGLSAGGTSVVAAMFGEAEEGTIAAYELLALDEADAYTLFKDVRVCSDAVKEKIYEAMLQYADTLPADEEIEAEESLDKLQKMAQDLFEMSVCRTIMIESKNTQTLGTLMEDYAAQLGISEAVSYTNLYMNNEIVTSTMRQKVLKSLAQYEWTEEEKENFADTADAIILLSVLSNISVYGKVADVITAAEALLKANGADWEAFSGLSNKIPVYRAIAGKKANADGEKFADMATFISFFNESVEDAGGNVSGGSATSGGGTKRGSQSAVVAVPGADAATAPLTAIHKAELFTDLEGAEWAKDAIYYFVGAGILSGRSETEFAPHDDIKREELAKLLTNALDLEAPPVAKVFTDVKYGTNWFYSHVAKAVGSGLMNGYGDAFGSGDSLTREDLAAICYRVLERAGKTYEDKQEALSFTDSGSISDYAKQAVAVLAELGVIDGMEDGTFAPQSCATRAQAAKIMWKVLELAKEGVE